MSAKAGPKLLWALRLVWDSGSGWAMATLARLVREAQAQAVTDHRPDLLHAKSIAVDLAYYENSRYYDALHRAQQEASLASEA